MSFVDAANERFDGPPRRRNEHVSYCRIWFRKFIELLYFFGGGVGEKYHVRWHTLPGVAGFNFRSIHGGLRSVLMAALFDWTEEAIDIVDMGRDGLVGGATGAICSSFSS